MEYSTSPFFDEAQALTIACEADPEVQVVTTNASAIPEVQLIHLKMADDFSTDYPGATTYEVQASTVAENESYERESISILAAALFRPHVI